MTQGVSVRLFLVDGVADGVITAEVINWTGHVLSAPRQALSRVLGHKEGARTGVYFLVGEDLDHPSRLKVYVGEGDAVGDRLKAHASDESKEFWTRCCLVTSTDTNLTKAHVRYLESRLVQMVKLNERANLANGNEPASRLLPESDQADMEYFLDQIALVLPVIGLEFLRPKPEVQDRTSDQSVMAFPERIENAPGSELGISSPLYLNLSYPEKGVDTEGYVLGGDYVVLAGSIGSTEHYASNNYSKTRQELIDDGSISIADHHARFIRDVTFGSPSAAAAVVLNRNANGRTEWRVRGAHQTLKDWQLQQIE